MMALLLSELISSIPSGAFIDVKEITDEMVENDQGESIPLIVQLYSGIAGQFDKKVTVKTRREWDSTYIILPMVTEIKYCPIWIESSYFVTTIYVKNKRSNMEVE